LQEKSDRKKNASPVSIFFDTARKTYIFICVDGMRTLAAKQGVEDMITFRAHCFLSANNLDASIFERVDGEQQRIDGAPWGVVFMSWIYRSWDAWEAQATKEERKIDNRQAAFDAWLSTSCEVSQ
jgi:hypothetical protein